MVFVRNLLLILLVAGCSTGRKATAVPGPKWKLAWQEEFDYTGLPDSSKWRYERGLVRGGEPQYYTVRRPENVRVENGQLIIETRKESFRGAPYTSGSINTRGKFAFGYGRVEIRAKLPAGSGIWPAIWMMGTQKEWPDGGEIDIMEYLGNDTSEITGTVHGQTLSHELSSKGGSVYCRDAPSRDFHIYAIERDENKIDFYFDQYKYFTYRFNHRPFPPDEFREPFYLLLNTALKKELNGVSLLDDNIFPQSFYIDYVRYYTRF